MTELIQTIFVLLQVIWLFKGVYTYRYLGVIIDDQVNWCNHVEYIYNKSMKHVGIFLQDSTSRKTTCCHIKTDLFCICSSIPLLWHWITRDLTSWDHQTCGDWHRETGQRETIHCIARVDIARLISVFEWAVFQFVIVFFFVVRLIVYRLRALCFLMKQSDEENY